MKIKNLGPWTLALALTGLLLFPACQCGECIPPSEEIQVCHLEGGEYNYDTCSCEF